MEIKDLLLTGVLANSFVDENKRKAECLEKMDTMMISCMKSRIDGVNISQLFLNKFENNDDVILQLSKPTGHKNKNYMELVFVECVSVQDYNDEDEKDINIILNHNYFQKCFKNSRFALLTWDEIIDLDNFNKENNKNYSILKIYTEPFVIHGGSEYFLCEVKI